MKIGELCNRRVVIANAGESVTQAAQRMREHHVGCLVVVVRQGDDSIPAGVVTDRDLVITALADENAAPASMTLAEVMSSDLLSAHEDDDVSAVMTRMRARGVRRVPVVDQAGRLQGIFTLDDALEWLSEQLRDLDVLIAREQRHERDTEL